MIFRRDGKVDDVMRCGLIEFNGSSRNSRDGVGFRHNRQVLHSQPPLGLQRPPGPSPPTQRKVQHAQVLDRGHVVAGESIGQSTTAPLDQDRRAAPGRPIPTVVICQSIRKVAPYKCHHPWPLADDEPGRILTCGYRTRAAGRSCRRPGGRRGRRKGTVSARARRGWEDN